MNLGIDIGRVIISPGDGPDDTSFIAGTPEQALATPALERAFPAIARLTRAFAGRVWLVSKCGPRVQERTRRWLEHHRFHETTGVREDHLVFCRRRPEKAEHCERLAITHFIDDRVDVLEPMRGRVPHLFLFGPQRAPLPAGEWCAPVRDWQCAEGAVLETLAPAATGREAAPECQLAPGPVA